MMADNAETPRPNPVRDLVTELLTYPWENDEPISGADVVDSVAPYMEAIRKMVAERRDLCGEDHGFAVWFDPEAIRQHYPESSGVAIPANVTDEDLADCSRNYGDFFWAAFDEEVECIVREATRRADERDAKAAPKAEVPE